MHVRGSRKFLKPAPTLYVEDHPQPPTQALFTLVSPLLGRVGVGS